MELQVRVQELQAKQISFLTSHAWLLFRTLLGEIVDWTTFSDLRDDRICSTRRIVLPFPQPLSSMERATVVRYRAYPSLDRVGCAHNEGFNDSKPLDKMSLIRPHSPISPHVVCRSFILEPRDRRPAGVYSALVEESRLVF